MLPGIVAERLRPRGLPRCGWLLPLLPHKPPHPPPPTPPHPTPPHHTTALRPYQTLLWRGGAGSAAPALAPPPPTRILVEVELGQLGQLQRRALHWVALELAHIGNGIDYVVHRAVVRAHRVGEGREADGAAVEGQAVEGEVLLVLVPAPLLLPLLGCQVATVLWHDGQGGWRHAGQAHELGMAVAVGAAVLGGLRGRRDAQACMDCDAHATPSEPASCPCCPRGVATTGFTAAALWLAAPACCAERTWLQHRSIWLV